MTRLLITTLFICIFVCVTSLQPTQARDPDICGQYAILSKIDEFYLVQEVRRKVNIDLTQIINEMDSIEAPGVLFKNIAEQYNTEEKLTAAEPDALIPYTNDFNLIEVQGTNPTFANICKQKGARMLEFEPEFKTKIANIMALRNINSTPFKAYPDKTYLVSGRGSVIDTPATPETKFPQLKHAYPQLRRDGMFEYPLEANLIAINTSMTSGLCLKPNNYWDLNTPARTKWLRTIKQIINSMNSIPIWKEAASKLITKLPLGQKTTETIKKVILRAPVQLRKMITFFDKYQYKESWENTSPSEVTDFFSYLDNFKAIGNFFKKVLKLNPKKGTVLLPLDEAELLKEQMAQGDLTIPNSTSLLVRPLHMAHQNGEDDSTLPSVMVAEIQTEGMDHDDLISIYLVKPLITVMPEIENNPVIPNITYIIQTKKEARAMQQQPLPYGCAEDEHDTQEGHIKYCRGFHIPKTTSLSTQKEHMCGKALISEEKSENIKHCPMQPPPDKPLVYQVQCQEMTAAISSPRPVAVRIRCNGKLTFTKTFTTFPVYLKTNCEIRELVGTKEEVLLPQRYDELIDLFENGSEDVTEISVIAPPQSNSTIAFGLNYDWFYSPRGLFSAIAGLALTAVCGCIFTIITKCCPGLITKTLKFICCSYWLFAKIGKGLKFIITCNSCSSCRKCKNKCKNKCKKSKKKNKKHRKSKKNKKPEPSSSDSSSDSSEESSDEAINKIEMAKLKRKQKKKRSTQPASTASAPPLDQVADDASIYTTQIPSNAPSMVSIAPPTPLQQSQSVGNLNNYPRQSPFVPGLGSEIQTPKTYAHSFRVQGR